MSGDRTAALAPPAQPPDPVAVHDGLAIYRIGDGSAAPLIDGLNRLGRQVVSFDPPGAGRSGRAARLSMAEMHDRANEALAVLGIAPPVDVLGHSMGGLTAHAYAIERPDRVRRLVLVGTGTGGRAYMSAPGALWNRGHPAFRRMAMLGILQIVWPRRAPEVLINDFIRRHSFVDRGGWPGGRASRPVTGCGRGGDGRTGTASPAGWTTDRAWRRSIARR